MPCLCDSIGPCHLPLSPVRAPLLHRLFCTVTRLVLDAVRQRRAVTLRPAWLSFNEDKLGSLEPGKLADLVVIDRDDLACPEDDIRKIKVLRTVVGGKTVFQR